MSDVRNKKRSNQSRSFLEPINKSSLAVLIIISILLCWFILSISGIHISDWFKDTPSEVSKDKLEEVIELEQTLVNRNTSLQETLLAFKKKIDIYSNTIKRIAEESGITTFTESQKNKRIQQYLSAIAKANAYREIIGREIQHIQSAQHELKGLKLHLGLDIDLLEGLETEKLEQLVAKLDVAITQYQPNAKELVLALDEKDLIPNDEIWAQYISSE